MRTRGLQRNVIPIRGDSSYTLGMHRDESLSFGFIDGDHSYEGVTADLEAMYPKIKKGGVLLLHDVLNTGEILNPAAVALRDFCTATKVTCEFMLAGTEMARVIVL